MSIVFCALIFALLFAIVVVNTTSASLKQEKNSSRFGKSETENITCKLYLEESDSHYSCEVYCRKTHNLIEDAKAAILGDENCRSGGYYFNMHELQLTKISNGWLKIDSFVNRITIKDYGKIVDIEPDALNDCTFRNLTEIELLGTGISIIKNGVFEGASSLKRVRLTNNQYMQVIEENALDPLYHLEDLKMTEQTQFENLINMTGTTQLKNLRTLTLSNNSFGSTINAETFKGCNNVETLILSNSLIQAIGIGSFDHMAATIKFLDLRHNQLTYLPSNLLENMIKPNIQFYLSFNLWHCDCETFELRWWDVSNSSAIIDSPLKCETPAMENEYEVGNADHLMCEPITTEITPTIPTPTEATTVSNTATTPETTTTPETPTTPEVPTAPDNTTSYWPTTTTMKPSNLDLVNCMYEKYLYLEKVYQYFNVKQLEMGKVSVEINIPDQSLSMVVVNDNEEARCRYDLNKKMIFDNLNPNSFHIFCLVKKNFYSTSPKNCVAFNFNQTNSIWYHDEIIIALACSIVLSLIVGILIGWLLSCRYHRFFKTKESLQYQSSTTSRKTTSEDLSISDYHGGKFSLDSGPTLRRSNSENSIISCKSYITAVTPSPFEIIQWKLRKNAMNSNAYPVRDYLDKLECDCLPPPLPPHPNRRNSDKIYETIPEPVYTCTSDIVPYRVTYTSPIYKS